jgi:serine/threonine protein kinase
MNGLQSFCREGVVWKHLRHPNVLPLLGVAVSGCRFAMVSEWMEHGNINEFVGKNGHVNRIELVRAINNHLHECLTNVLSSWLALRVA